MVAVPLAQPETRSVAEIATQAASRSLFTLALHVGAIGSRSVSVELGTVKSQEDEAWQPVVASPCILWAAETMG